MTGIENFTELSKDPLKLPDYYDLSKDSELLPEKLQEPSDEQKKGPKAKRPDDKIDRETKSLRRQNDRNLERRPKPGPEDTKGEKTNDMFYKKESDRQIFSGTESEFEEIAEVKPKSKDSKILKITESDFENDLLVKEKPRKKMGSQKDQE
jgi:hypothetical protein